MEVNELTGRQRKMKSNCPLRAVLFDLGGTLFDYRCLARAAAQTLVSAARAAGIDADADVILQTYRVTLREMLRKYEADSFYRLGDLLHEAAIEMVARLGATPSMEYVASKTTSWELLAGFGGRAVAEDAGRHTTDWRTFVGLARGEFRLRDGVLETLAKLRNQALVLGIVSNIDEDQLADAMEISNLASSVDFVLSSERAGSCKPDPGIFAEALRIADCRPDEAMFVGDSTSQDIAGANAAGLRSVLLWYRTDTEPPDNGPMPDHVIRQIGDLIDLVEGLGGSD
jgi:HAD superfamily hydrolase (TIGR01549 family)